jgi:signal recognition particle subunit SRP54
MPRGGAALSMRAVTGKPIKLIGLGEKIDALETFHPDRVAGRILGMGDIVGLVEKAQATVEAESRRDCAAKIKKGEFDFDDMLSQLAPGAEDGRPRRRHGHAARRRQDARRR